MKSNNQTITKANNSHLGFTLIEMLVVIGIISVLAGATIMSFSKMGKSADKAQAQDLVGQVATALTAIYDADGCWPKSIREASVLKDGEKGLVDSNIALILARRGYMSLAMNKEKTRLVGHDRFGVLTPWAAKALAQKGSNVSADESDILNFAVDINGDGIIKDDEHNKRLGAKVHIRATAIAWCYDKSGKQDERHRIQSWTDKQKWEEK